MKQTTARHECGTCGYVSGNAVVTERPAQCPRCYSETLVPVTTPPSRNPEAHRYAMTHEALANAIMRRIDSAGGTPRHTVVGRADPTAHRSNECLVAFGDYTDDGDAEWDGPSPVVRHFEVRYVDCVGLSFEVHDREAGMRYKALYDQHEKRFVNNQAWQSLQTINVLVDLLAEAVWYGPQDRAPSPEKIFC